MQLRWALQTFNCRILSNFNKIGCWWIIKKSGNTFQDLEFSLTVSHCQTIEKLWIGCFKKPVNQSYFDDKKISTVSWFHQSRKKVYILHLGTFTNKYRNSYIVLSLKCVWSIILILNWVKLHSTYTSV